MKECPNCHKQVDESSCFCPFCGEDLQQKKVGMDESLRCPSCHGIIHEDDMTCPHCQKKLKYLEKLYPNEKRGILSLLLVGVGVAFCIVPFVSIICLVLALVFSLLEKDKCRYTKDATLFSIIGLCITVGIFVVSLIINLQNQSQTAMSFLFLY